jgi:hypothetical protein
MSTSAHQVPLSTTIVERRFYPRIVPQAPIFVAFNENESQGSLLLNVSENGLLLSTPTDLTANFVARLSLPLNGLPKPVQVTARVLWTSESGNLAGIQLLDLSEHDRRQIRKWGARESAKSSPLEPDHPFLLVVPPSKASSDNACATFPCKRGTPVNTTLDIVPLAPPPIVGQRSISIVERCVIWGLYLATACLVAVFFLRSEVLGNLLPHPESNRSQTSVAAALIQDTELTPQASNLASRAVDSQAVPPVPIHESIVPQRANTVGLSTRQDSEKRTEAPRKTASGESPAETQNVLSLTAALPAPTEADLESSTDSPQPTIPAEVPKEATPEPETLPSPEPPTPAEPLPNPTRASDAPFTNSAAIRSSTSSTQPSSPIVAPARPSLSPNSAPTVIHMDPPRSQTLEIHLPSGHPAAFLNFPGERVIESPSVTMHIHRSVLMPASDGGWLASRNKKVIVGELISRADPQIAQIPTGAAASVRVKATISKDGHIGNVKLVVGPASLAPAIAKALHEWRYQPTLVDNKPVETQCYVIFQFHPSEYHAAKR